MVDQPEAYAVAEHRLGRARTGVYAVATNASAPLNAPSSAQNLLPLDAALTRREMVEARALAQAMSEGAKCCAVDGVVANRDNRLDRAARSLSCCLATLERTRSPRAQ